MSSGQETFTITKVNGEYGQPLKSGDDITLTENVQQVDSSNMPQDQTNDLNPQDGGKKRKTNKKKTGGKKRKTSKTEKKQRTIGGSLVRGSLVKKVRKGLGV